MTKMNTRKTKKKMMKTTKKMVKTTKKETTTSHPLALSPSTPQNSSPDFHSPFVFSQWYLFKSGLSFFHECGGRRLPNVIESLVLTRLMAT